MSEQKVPVKGIDPLLRIKHIAYCRSQTPLSGFTLKDLVQFAKFRLCLLTNTLFKDPIWDLYTSEEILIEFFSHRMAKDKEFLTEFELQLAKGDILDFSAWADLQIKKEAQLKEEQLKKLEDRVSFSPDDVMGDN